MSLYGDDPRYTVGALRNAQRLPVVFPGWKLRFYYRSGDVPAHLLARLDELGAELIDVTRGAGTSSTLAPMLWRMAALDDPTVDVVLCRDADSRLSQRDAGAVDAWLAAEDRPAFHCIRDHPSHAERPVNGGLWGARRRRLLDVLGGRAVTPLLADFGAAYMDDMRFLDEHVWTPLTTPSRRHEIYCHDSVSCDDRWPGTHRLSAPRRWPGEHVGQVFDAWTRPRQGDVDLLVSSNNSTSCPPQTVTQSDDATLRNTTLSGRLRRWFSLIGKALWTSSGDNLSLTQLSR